MKNSESPQRGESTSAQDCGVVNSPTRILVVDDDAEIRQVSAGALIRSGYHAETASDGAAAWKSLQEKSYALLITDNQMPKVSGLELVKKVRSAHMTLPVILASGALPTEDLEQNAWLQPVATLAKPFSTDQLLDKVYEVLAQPPA